MKKRKPKSEMEKLLDSVDFFLKFGMASFFGTIIGGTVGILIILYLMIFK